MQMSQVKVIHKYDTFRVQLISSTQKVPFSLL